MSSARYSRRIASFLTLTAVAFPFASFATEDLVDGRDYTPLAQPRAPEIAGAVEVIEFFSYGCRGCYLFEPSLARWTATLPAHTLFTRIPISLGYPKWKPLARAHYSLETTGDLTRLRAPLFDAVHKQHKVLADGASIAAWIAEQGGDSAAFLRAFESDRVSDQAQRSEALARSFQVDRTPRLVIDRRYMVIGKEAKGFEDWLSIADRLIEKSRHERALS